MTRNLLRAGALSCALLTTTAGGATRLNTHLADAFARYAGPGRLPDRVDAMVWTFTS